MESTTNDSVVFLVATDTEARPLLEALRVAERMEVATREVYLGGLDIVSPDLPDGDPAGAAEPKATTVPVVLAVSGCDKVNTAHTLACVLQTVCTDPALVVQVGIAGAFRGADGGQGDTVGDVGPGVGDIVLATQEAYSDTGSSSPHGWLSANDLGLPLARGEEGETYGVFPLDGRLVESARLAILAGLDEEDRASVHAGPCVTSSLVTGTREEADELNERWGALAESMEGAAAAHVCCLHGVPFLQVRGISNLVGDRDRTAWWVEEGASIAGKAALLVVRALWEERPW